MPYHQITDVDLTALLLKHDLQCDEISIRDKKVKLPYLIQDIEVPLHLNGSPLVTFSLRTYCDSKSHWRISGGNSIFYEHENGDCYILMRQSARTDRMFDFYDTDPGDPSILLFVKPLQRIDLQAFKNLYELHEAFCENFNR